MNPTKISLSLIKVASPCTASWEAMSGDDTTRFCGQCSQYVYNLSEMTEAQAQSLIEENEGKLCARLYQRADGTMMTKDCPVGWRAFKRRVALIAGAATTFLFASLGVVTAGAVAASVKGNGNGGVRVVNPIQRVHDWLFPPRAIVMGDICPPPVQPAQNDPANVVMGGIAPHQAPQDDAKK